MKKKIGIVIFTIALIVAGKYVYDMHINHNFEIITDGKVYKSGVIPPNEIADYVKEYKIKSIIDLRFPGTADLENNPEIPSELKAEQNAVAKIKGVKYFNNGSDQIPNQKNLDTFYKIMDKKDNYPILIHCFHGTGRAELYSGIYRIEYEKWTNDDARNAVRNLIKFSSFDDGKPKGEFLKSYKRRKQLLNK